MPDRASGRLCRSGAAVENLAPSASFHAYVNGAPSKPGIKHLDAEIDTLVTNHNGLVASDPWISPSEATSRHVRVRQSISQDRRCPIRDA